MVTLLVALLTWTAAAQPQREVRATDHGRGPDRRGDPERDGDAHAARAAGHAAAGRADE